MSDPCPVKPLLRDETAAIGTNGQRNAISQPKKLQAFVTALETSTPSTVILSRHRKLVTFRAPSCRLHLSNGNAPLQYNCWAAGFEGMVIPGLLMASMFPAIIAAAFPGAIYLSQTLKFRHPAVVIALLRWLVAYLRQR